LDTIFLTLLSENAEQGLHGYKVMQMTKKKYGIFLSPSSLYPVLRFMEKDGLLKSEWQIINNKFRRVYKISSQGQQSLRDYQMQLRLIVPPFNGGNVLLTGAPIYK